MAPSGWTRSLEAVRDTMVVDYSVPGVKATLHVAYRPLITVSPFLLIPSVSYFKRSLWHWAQLWPHVAMSSLGTHLHRVCISMGGAGIISPRIPSTCAQNAILSSLITHIIPGHQSYVAIDNPSLVPSLCCHTTDSYLWNHMHPADNVSHAENIQSNGCRSVSQLYKIRDGNLVTWVFRYCDERQG